MNSPDIISIVPALPPSVNGLGDYSWLLAKELKRSFNRNTFFLSVEVSSSASIFQAETITDNSPDSLQSLLSKNQAGDILIHYVSYAYSTLGLPWWLLNGLKKYKAKNPACRIITVFHELYSSGLPWQKAFWTKPFQKEITFQLLKLSDQVVCNTRLTYSIVKKRTEAVSFLPVFSNVGEPSSVPSLMERKNSMVVFGSAPLRKRVNEHKNQLEHWLQKLQVNEIIEIGPGRSKLNNGTGVPINYKGVLSLDGISEILLSSKYGTLAYPENLLTKSGVFAAYAAHGVAPVVLGDKNKVNTDIKNNFHFISEKETVDPELISSMNFSWYQDHSVKNSARLIFNLFEKITKDNIYNTTNEYH